MSFGTEAYRLKACDLVGVSFGKRAKWHAFHLARVSFGTYKCHSVSVPFGIRVTWHACHLASVSFGTHAIWHACHLGSMPGFCTRVIWHAFYLFKVCAKTDNIGFINSCEDFQKQKMTERRNAGLRPVGGGGELTKFYSGRLRPEVQPLTLLYTILAEKVPLLYTF